MSIELGTEAPFFELPGVDGYDHSLDEYGDATLLILVQSCNHCPYVLAWEDRLMAIAQEHSHEGVRVVAVNSNDVSRYPEDSFEQMKARAEKRDFPFDYLFDEDQSLAHALGAEHTPEVFLFDAERRLRYHGAIDDSRDENEVKQNYLRDAIEALLSGDEPPVAETPAVGCTVKWKQ
ncbi:MAG: thioredoxin family protein [Gaiellaceae bacterium]|jgi:peroxiredoxin